MVSITGSGSESQPLPIGNTPSKRTYRRTLQERRRARVKEIKETYGLSIPQCYIDLNRTLIYSPSDRLTSRIALLEIFSRNATLSRHDGILAR